MKRLSWFVIGSMSLAGAAAYAQIGCGDSDGSTFGSGPSTTPDAAAGTTPAAFLPPGDLDGPWTDFPKDPLIDGNAPANAAALFAAASVGQAGGPCLMEPEPGSMLPKNWLRPRFRWIQANALGDAGSTGAAQDLFELRLHTEKQTNDLVVYTQNPAWTMPKEMWEQLRLHSAGAELTMTIRGGTLAGGALTNASSGSSGPLAIAPVDAPGTIVYWTTTAGGPGGVDSGSLYNPVLKAFHVGDESVSEVLRPSQLAPTGAGAVKCVGCHTSTPDGLFTVASLRPNSSGGGFTQIGFGKVDGGAGAPPYVTAQAQGLLDRSEQMSPTFSAAHWATGDRIAVSMYKSIPGFDIVWTNLETTSSDEGTGWGVFKRNGDANWAALANASHDGTKLVYVSTPDEETAGTEVFHGKIFTVPWGDRAGGNATEVLGANVDGSKQFYPSFSPDDQLIAFDRSPVNEAKDSYDDPNAEIYVVPSGGGTATRMTANHPPACSGAKSPGTFNSWPKWSPQAIEVGTKKYYFIVFSSARNHGTTRFGARLYITPVVVENGTVKTYSALYLWNQPEDEDNHSPAWDSLKIPESSVN